MATAHETTTPTYRTECANAAVTPARGAPADAPPTAPASGTDADVAKAKAFFQLKLNLLSPSTVDEHVQAMLDYRGVQSGEILDAVVDVVFENAIKNVAVLPVFARLCEQLSTGAGWTEAALKTMLLEKAESPWGAGWYVCLGRPTDVSSLKGPFPSRDAAESVGKQMTFKRCLLNRCEAEFKKAVVSAVNIERARAVSAFLATLYSEGMTNSLIFRFMCSSLCACGNMSSITDDMVECLCTVVDIGAQKFELDAPENKSFADAIFLTIDDVAKRESLPERSRRKCKEVLMLRSNAWSRS